MTFHVLKICSIIFLRMNEVQKGLRSEPELKESLSGKTAENELQALSAPAKSNRTVSLSSTTSI